MFVLVFTLPALACSLFQTQDLDATATFIAGNIFATMTAEAPTTTYTATVMPTETVTPTPTITDTPLPTDTPKPTVPSEPSFGVITFAMGVSEDKQPINPMTEFPKGVTKIFGVFEFQGMSDGWHWSPIFFRNGEEYASASREWDHGVNGITFADLYYPDGKALESGNYELKLFVGDKLMQSGKFKIGQ
jgi:hypothetical protein